MKENIIMRKSFAFSVRIMNLHKYLCRKKGEYVVSRQICKSGTSIGCDCCTKQSICPIRNLPACMATYLNF